MIHIWKCCIRYYAVYRILSWMGFLYLKIQYRRCCVARISQLYSTSLSGWPSSWFNRPWVHPPGPQGEGDLPCYKTGDGCVLIYGVFWWNMIYLSYSVFGILFILRRNQVISHGVPEYDRFIDGILQTEGLQVIICAFLLYHPNHVLPNSVA